VLLQIKPWLCHSKIQNMEPSTNKSRTWLEFLLKWSKIELHNYVQSHFYQIGVYWSTCHECRSIFQPRFKLFAFNGSYFISGASWNHGCTERSFFTFLWMVLVIFWRHFKLAAIEQYEVSSSLDFENPKKKTISPNFNLFVLNINGFHLSSVYKATLSST